jgi:hypothetical protein
MIKPKHYTQVLHFAINQLLSFSWFWLDGQPRRRRAGQLLAEMKERGEGAGAAGTIRVSMDLLMEPSTPISASRRSNRTNGRKLAAQI